MRHLLSKGVKVMKKLFFIALILYFNLIFVAQGGPSIRMDPILVEKSARPGESFSYFLNIENTDKFSPLTLDVFITDFVEDEFGTYQLVPQGSTPYSAARWIKISPEKLTIHPGKTRTVKVTVTIPRGVTGGLYSAIVFKIHPEKGVEEGALGETLFEFQIASFLELIIKGTAQRLEAYAVSFEVERSKKYMFLRQKVGDDALVFTTTVLNQGNVHIFAKGILTLKTKQGRTVARMPLGGGRGIILPNAKVKLMSVFTRQLPPGEYVARAIISYGGNRPIVAETPFSIREEKLIAEKTSAKEIACFLVEPQNLEVELKPGSFRSVVVKIANRGKETIKLAGYVFPLVFDIYGNISPEAGREEKFPWVEVKPSVFTLKPGQTRRVRLVMKPPKDAKGGYYADVVFKSYEENSYSENGASLLLFVGDKKKALRKGTLKLKTLDITKNSVGMDFLFFNEGAIHLNAKIEIVLNKLHPQVILEDGRIIPPRSEKITVAVLSGENPIFPGTKRIFSFMIPISLDPGEYEILARVDYGEDEPSISRTKFTIVGSVNHEDN